MLPRSRISAIFFVAYSLKSAAEKSCPGSTKSSPQWATPCISMGVGLAVPMSMSRYTVLLSAHIISPPNFFANFIAKDVLPLAVGPVITIKGAVCSSLLASIAAPQNQLFATVRHKRSHLVQAIVFVPLDHQENQQLIRPWH